MCSERDVSKRLCMSVSVEKPSVLKPWVIKEGFLETVGKGWGGGGIPSGGKACMKAQNQLHSTCLESRSDAC